jgi:hypothetical protein
VRRRYIQSRLALADWIVMDDTFVDFYQHLPEREYGVVKQYYRDLFAGRLDFQLIKTFKVYPSLFGHPIVDDGAELTFRLFDHPRVFVFARARPRERVAHASPWPQAAHSRTARTHVGRSPTIRSRTAVDGQELLTVDLASSRLADDVAPARELPHEPVGEARGHDVQHRESA